MNDSDYGFLPSKGHIVECHDGRIVVLWTNPQGQWLFEIYTPIFWESFSLTEDISLFLLRDLTN